MNAACTPSTAMTDVLNHGGVMVKDARRCSARRARCIRGFNPHSSGNIYTDFVFTVVEKRQVLLLQIERNIIILHRKIVNFFRQSFFTTSKQSTIRFIPDDIATTNSYKGCYGRLSLRR